MRRCPPGTTLLLLTMLACDGGTSPGNSFAGLDSVATNIAVGDAHSCRLDASSNAICWGRGTDGQLGGDSTPLMAGPATVSGGHQFTALVAGRFHTCGLTPQGAVWCWGLDQNAQLGAGAPAGGSCTGGPCATAPVAVTGNLSLTSIAGSGQETCGLTADGSAWCWGLSEFGQLGGPAGDTCPDGPCSRSPVAVTGGHQFAQLSVSSSGHVCGLTDQGEAWCWGLNHQGQLGVDSVFDYIETPLAVRGGHHFRRISAGGKHTCALTGGGTAWCWGLDVLPLLNSGDFTYYHPNKVPTALRFATIESGQVSECGLTAQGAAYCWGTNSAGEVGTTPIGSTFRFDTPIAVGGGLSFVELWGESQTYCATSSAGGLYCWGSGTRGELGSGATNSIVPVRVPGS